MTKSKSKKTTKSKYVKYHNDGTIWAKGTMAVINRMVIGSGFVKLAPLSVQGILTKANKLVNGLLMMQRGKGL